MRKFDRLKTSFSRVKKPLSHVKKVKNVKWLLPGWILYEFYKVHKKKGYKPVKSLSYGAKAEATRLAAMAGIPLPGTYELTTTGLALIKRKIENDEVDRFTLRTFKDFIPIRKFRVRNDNIKCKPYLVIYYRNKKLCFDVFYR